MRPRRRLVAVVVAAAVALAGVFGAQAWHGGHEVIPLHQAGVARDAEGRLVPLSASRWDERASAARPAHPQVLPPEEGWAPERRSLGAGLAASRRAAAQAWLRAGTLPGEGTAYEPMARRALLDLRALTGPMLLEADGAPVTVAPGAVLAAPSANWRYVWPRDAAFVAVAYARAGHVVDALSVLYVLRSLQDPDGGMPARWLPDGSGDVPDDRPPQEDGPGWALWAVGELLAEVADPSTREAVGTLLGPLVARSAGRLLDRLDPATGLPRPSPDYWEVPERRLTLGVAATSLMGLEAAARVAATGLVAEEVWASAGVEPDLLAGAAERLRARVVVAFGPGYPRHVGRDNPDAAVTFVLPPFLGCALPGAEEARLESLERMRRPAGGVAPGSSWKADGISWTPETALQALAAAATGREAEARMWLDWLGAHRTGAGSLPEKVLFDGRPAAVAPLAWTAALVLITLSQDPARDDGC